MSRSSSVFSDVNGESDAKRIFKSINNIVRYLDQEKDASRTYLDLFHKKIEIQRAKLCTYVERIMFMAPVEYGKKCEDILWKKAYYDIYTTMKLLKKDAPWTMDEISNLQHVLNRGIGNYHHLITRLQHEYRLKLDDVIDFPLNFLNYGMAKSSECKKLSSSYYNESQQTELAEKWAERCAYHCLLYIGDLNRYMLDLYPGSDTKVAVQYYWKAFHLSPTNGMPHNQLATLANYYNDILDAVYHYMRCLCSVKPFYGASGNLTAIIDQNHPSKYETNIISIGLTPYRRVLLQFLHLIDIWYFNNIDDSSKLCMEFLENLDTWMALNTDKVSIRGNITDLTEIFLHKDEKPIERSVNDDSLLKIIVICFVCHWKYKRSNNGKIYKLETLILKLICRPIEYVVRKLRNVLPVPKDMNLSGSNESLHKRRRKRRMRGEKITNGSICDESEDISEDGGFSTDSEEELALDEDHSVVETENKINGHECNGLTNGFHKKCESEADILYSTCKEYIYIIQAIKVSFDWLRCNPKLWSFDMFEGQLENVVIMLNYFRNFNSKSNGGDTQKENGIMCPLVEDFKLRQFPPLRSIQETETWDFAKACNLPPEKQMEIRAEKIREFGKLLAKSLPLMMEYDEKSNWFSVREVACETKNTNGMDKSKLMTKLWLESEVKNLECKMEETAKANSLPPYLLLDCKALTQHCILIKKLVHSRKFIILVPSVVVSALDELKRTSGGARDAVRWLEGQFRQGNRYIRAQRANEKLTLLDVTYPKKKDKEAWLLMQIFEFCYYLNSINKNTKEGSNTIRDECNFVRLLTGSKEMVNEIASSKNGVKNNSIASIAESSGIIVEHVMDFYDNWKKTNKSYG